MIKSGPMSLKTVCLALLFGVCSATSEAVTDPQKLSLEDVLPESADTLAEQALFSQMVASVVQELGSLNEAPPPPPTIHSIVPAWATPTVGDATSSEVPIPQTVRPSASAAPGSSQLSGRLFTLGTHIASQFPSAAASVEIVYNGHTSWMNVDQLPSSIQSNLNEAAASGSSQISNTTSTDSSQYATSKTPQSSAGSSTSTSFTSPTASQINPQAASTLTAQRSDKSPNRFGGLGSEGVAIGSAMAAIFVANCLILTYFADSI